MEIRELRIGNLVTYSIEALPVACIYKDSVSFAPIRESPWRTTPIELIKPIPLTEEWLWKFRFTKDRYNDYSIMINTPDKQLAFTSLEDGSFFPTINEMGELSHALAMYSFE